MKYWFNFLVLRLLAHARVLKSDNDCYIMEYCACRDQVKEDDGSISGSGSGSSLPAD